VKEPFVDAHRRVKPHDVVEARDLHLATEERDAVREERRAEKSVV
jgi:hypothetical protein